MANKARWQITVTDEAGNRVPGASVLVRRELAGFPIETLYSDRAGTTPIANPVIADADGFVAFHTLGGAFRIDASLGAFSRTWRYQGIGTASEFDTEALLVGIVNKGQWATATVYLVNDIVHLNGSEYIAIADHTSGASSQPGIGASWTTDWQLIAARGNDAPIWLFDTSTANSDPGTGKIRLSNAAPASATAIYISENSGEFGNPSLATWLGLMDNSQNLINRGLILIKSVNNPGTYAYYRVNAARVDNGAWDTFSVVTVGNAGTFLANEQVSVSLLPNNDPATENLNWQFSSTTAMADPGAGFYRLNNATRSSVTAIALDDVSALVATDVSAFFNSWDDTTSVVKGYLTMIRTDKADDFAVFRLDSLTDNSGWSQLNVTYLTGFGNPTANARYSFFFSPTGDRGDPAGLKWQLASSVVMSDPGPGLFRFNNAAVASATAIALNDTIGETGNPAADAWFNSWAGSTSSNKGFLTIKDSLNAAVFAIFFVTGVTDNSGWSQIAVTHIASAGTFTAGRSFSHDFVRTGDKGDPGNGVNFAVISSATLVAADLAVFGDVSDSNNNKQTTWQAAVEAAGDDKFYSKVRVTQTYTTTSNTLQLTDAGKVVTLDNASANVLTVPPNASVAFAIGTQIDGQQLGAGQTTITPGAGVTLRSRNGRLKTAAQYAGFTLVKAGTNTWDVYGDLVA